MILINATIKYKGYSPLTLSHGSGKRVCVSCNRCGRINYTEFKSYKNLCLSCSKKGIKFTSNHKANLSKSHADFKGDKNPMFGKINNKHWAFDKRGEGTPNWRGGISNIRNHLILERDCIKLNSRFDDSSFHHITKSVGIYIPKELHQSIWHDLKNYKNMNKINELAMGYLLNKL